MSFSKKPMKLTTKAELVIFPRPNIRRLVRAAQFDDNMEMISSKLDDMLVELQRYTKEIDLRYRQGSRRDFNQKGSEQTRGSKLAQKQDLHRSSSLHEFDTQLSIIGLYGEAEESESISKEHDFESDETPATDIILDLIYDDSVPNSAANDVDSDISEKSIKPIDSDSVGGPKLSDDKISGQSGQQYHISGPFFLLPNDQLPISLPLEPNSQPFRKVISSVEDTINGYLDIDNEIPNVNTRGNKVKTMLSRISKLASRRRWFPRRPKKQLLPSIVSEYTTFKEASSIILPEGTNMEEEEVGLDTSTIEEIYTPTMEEFYTRKSLTKGLASLLSLELPRLKIDRWVQTEPIVAEEVANMAYEAFKTKAHRLRMSIRSSLTSFRLLGRPLSTIYSGDRSDAMQTRGSSLQSFTAYASRHLI